MIKYSQKEKILFEYLREQNSISLKKFCNIAHIPRQKAIQILVNLILIKIINIDYSQQKTTFCINKELKTEEQIRSKISALE